MELKRNNARPPWQKPKVAQSGRKADNSAFYNSTVWRKCRAAYRNSHPLCECCRHFGRTTVAAVTDHIVSIATGGAKLDTANLMSLCDGLSGYGCHDRKSRLESSGLDIPSTKNADGDLIPANRRSVFEKLS